jgi:hypothetical protein
METKSETASAIIGALADAEGGGIPANLPRYLLELGIARWKKAILALASALACAECDGTGRGGGEGRCRKCAEARKGVADFQGQKSRMSS